MASDGEERKRKAEEEAGGEEQAGEGAKRHQGTAPAASDEGQQGQEQQGQVAGEGEGQGQELGQEQREQAAGGGGGAGEGEGEAPAGDKPSEGGPADPTHPEGSKGPEAAGAGAGASEGTKEGAGAEGAAEGAGAAAEGAQESAGAGGGAGTGSPVLDAVVSAIRQLKSHKGSSLKAIQKVCAEQLGIKDGEEVKVAIKSGVAKGVLTQVRASYLVAGDPAYEDTAEKVSIEEKEPGKEGARKAAKGDTARIAYVGTLADGGHKFDEGTGFEFEVGGGDVIKGMDAGVLGMRVGARRVVTIPPSLGYGKRGSKPDIPPNATLVFDITLEALE